MCRSQQPKGWVCVKGTYFTLSTFFTAFVADACVFWAKKGWTLKTLSTVWTRVSKKKKEKNWHLCDKINKHINLKKNSFEKKKNIEKRNLR